MYLGSKSLRNLAFMIKKNSNPSMDGWLFEMLFYADLTESDITLFDHDRNQETWTKAEEMVLFEPENEKLPLIKDDGAWLRPSKWNNGGYDLVYIDKNNGLVRMVQVRKGDTHSFKIGYFATFLAQLRDSDYGMTVETLDIVFVIDSKEMENFKITETTGEGLLSAFKGWKKYKEKDTVRILAFEGWDV
jgi:hypothetical protein